MPKTWSYGVCTVKERLNTLLPQTLASLAEAGFAQPRLFADATVHDEARLLENRFNLPVTPRWLRIRAYGNWLLGLVELVCREPMADFYALFQDDLLACKNLRPYLERCAYPCPRVRESNGYWNLFTMTENEDKVPLFNGTQKQTGWWQSNQRGRGALGLVFNRITAYNLLATAHTWDRMGDRRRGCQAIDGAIVTALAQHGGKEYIHYPSLLYHTGVESSMTEHHHNHPCTQPQATSFPGADFDALSLLQKK